MVFDFLRRGSAGQAPEAKASAAGPVVAWQTGKGHRSGNNRHKR